MKIRTLVLAVVLFALAGAGGRAQELMIAPDTSGCCTYAPYSWVTLAPGQSFKATLDMSKCAPSDLGWFYYYGYISTNNGSNFLTDKDGIQLKILNLTTGEVSTPGTNANHQVNILLQVTAPTSFQLTATNAGRKTVTIRLTWVTFYKT